jgi:hypothetical protein
MSQTLKLDDPVFILITDALRAGPGTPEWQDAVTRLRAQGQEHSDEYELLYSAREHLSSGREFREVRAGPQFTRKVLSAIELEQMSPRRSVSVATIIAILSAFVVVGVVLAVGKFLIRADVPKAPMAEELGQLYFVNPVASTAFDERAVGEWKYFGTLNVQKFGDLHVTEMPASQSYIGGGVYLDSGLSSGEPVEVAATIRMPKRSENIVAQLFITDEPSFGGESATTPHELVFMLRNGEGSVVLPSGGVAPKTIAIAPSTLPLEVRVKLNRDSAIVEVGANRIYAGLHELDPTRARYAGVRLLARASEEDSITVSSVRVQTPQKK